MAIFRVTAPSNITVTLSYQSRDSKFYSWSKTASVWQDKVHDKTEVIGLHNNQSSTGLTDKYVFDYGSLHKDDKEEIEAKVLKYLEEKEDWVESEASEECTRRMEARMEANWNK